MQTAAPPGGLDVVALGRIAIDFNPKQIHCSLAEADTFTKYVGGSPANIAVGLARLGRRAGFIGKVSDDRFGEYVCEYFAEEGIDTSRITKSTGGEKLGLAFTEVLSPTESSLIMYREGVADLRLAPEDVDEEYIACAKYLLISGTALSRSPSREAALKAIQLAKKRGVKVVFDIDYRAYSWVSPDEVTTYYALAGSQSDMIVGSREEFDLMERFLFKTTGDDGQSASYWLANGARLLIIKHGKHGSFAYAPGESYRVKPFPVTLLKSFGGGDGYAAALLHGLLEDWPLQKALTYATAAASMLVAAESCAASMPGFEALDGFVRENLDKYGEMVTPEKGE